MNRWVIAGLLGMAMACQKQPELPLPQGWQYQETMGAPHGEALFATLDGEPTEEFDERDGFGPLSSRFDLRSPAPEGVAYGDPLVVDLRYKGDVNQAFVVHLDGTPLPGGLQTGPVNDQWTYALPHLEPGRHRLAFVSRQQAGKGFEARFSYQTEAPLQRVTALADASVRRVPPETLAWDWREGLFLYALTRLDAQLGQTRYRPYVAAYFRHYLKQGIPKINWSDKCVPGLAALELYQATGDRDYLAIAQKVIAYLGDAKPTKGGGLNHMGTSPYAWVYPDSMWVDSLMMYNVLAARYGALINDSGMSTFAVEQAAAFARVLQHPDTGLWKHAYLTNWERPIPKTDTYWLRGNGWALASLAETLPLVRANHPQRATLQTVFQKTADAMRPHQTATGLWYTVLNRPGKSYLESSGTALAAYGLLVGSQQGWLGPEARQAGEKAYLGLLGRLEATVQGPSMPEISHHTMPYSFLGYRLVPQRSDLPHGLAALILAGVAHANLSSL